MKKSFLLFTMIFVLVYGIQISFAQTKIISGSVKDDKGEAVIGASVLVKGTTTGTYTDADGNFSLAVPVDATTLTVKYLGMKTKEVEIGTGSIAVTLEEDVLGLDEVVVTALGISREKKSLGYATQGVSSDQMNKSGTGNPLSELQGKVSGLTVINSGGTPGQGTYMQLRGITSLTGSNQPLIVVDGIPLDNSVNGYDATSGNTADLNPVGGTATANRGIDIDPSDIESINVLKGPAASALYGIQAASGAIIITTKKGGSFPGKGTHVEYSVSRSIDKVNKLPESQMEYGQGSGGIYKGPETGTSLSWGPSVDTLYWNGASDYPFDKNGKIVGKSDPNAKTKITPYNNPKDFFVTGSTWNNNLTLSGGTASNGYRIGISNLHQKGIVPVTKYDKTTVTLSGQSVLTNRLSISGGVTYVKSSTYGAQQGSNVSGLMLGLVRTPNTFDNGNGNTDPAYDSTSYVLPNGNQRNYRGGGGYDNPYWTINRNPYWSDLNRFFGFTQADYKLNNWLSLTYRLGGDVYGQDNKQAYDLKSRAFPTGLVYLDRFTNQQYNSDLIATIKKDFNKDWSGSLVLGHNYFTVKSTRAFVQGTGFIIPEFYDMSNASSVLGSEAEGSKRTMAFYGQAEIAYKSMVYLNLTGRRETSSTLPAKNNSFFYPSANISFIFTEPLHLSDNKIFPYGKLRLSYAQVGKDAPVSALQTYYNLTTFSDGFTPGIQFPINGVQGYVISTSGPTISSIGNPDLKPEKTNSFEIGTDLAFLQNRISFSATYFSEKTVDAIFPVNISYATGWGGLVKNAGVLTNKGVELTLGLTPLKLTNGLRWDITANWSAYRNKVVTLSEGIDNVLIAGFTNGAIYALKGEPYGVIYGSDYVRTDDGTMIISDVQDDGYGMPIPGADNVKIGNTQPKWLGSVINSLSFKGFHLGFQIDIRHKGDIWNGTIGAMDYFGTAKETANRGDSTTFEGVLGHLNEAGEIVHYASDGVTEEAGPGASNNVKQAYNQYYWQNIGSSFIGPTQPSVEDGSFVRVRQISLSYDMPKSVLKAIHFYSASITLYANNPFLWTKYKGVDPESSLVGPINGQGLDYFNMPGIKSFGARINVGL